MKKNLIYFLALLFLGFMTSCTDDEDPAASTPTIAFSGIPEGETTQGEFTEAIKALVAAPEKIASLTITIPLVTPAGVVDVETDLALDPNEQPAIGGVNYHTAIHTALGVNYKDVEGEKNYTLTISPALLNTLTAGSYSIPMSVKDREEMTTSATAELTVAATVAPAVTVAFKVGEDDVTDSVTVDHGTALTIVPTSNTGAAIKSVTVNDMAVDGVDGVYSYTLGASGAYTVVATDENDVVSEATVIKAGLNLTAAKAFTWARIDGAAGTGLGTYGLAWTSNTTENAIVAAEGTTKLVQLTSDDWAGVTTQSQLAAIVMAGTAIDDYRGVSVTEASKTYDDVLATEVTDVDGAKTYYLIHITKVVNEEGNNSATNTTITGESKDDLYATTTNM